MLDLPCAIIIPASLEDRLNLLFELLFGFSRMRLIVISTAINTYDLADGANTVLVAQIINNCLNYFWPCFPSISAALFLFPKKIGRRLGKEKSFSFLSSPTILGCHSPFLAVGFLAVSGVALLPLWYD